MGLSLNSAKIFIKKKKISIIHVSTYQQNEKKVKHIKFLNKAIVKILQLNPFVALYSYMEGSCLPDTIEHSTTTISSINSSKNKQILEKKLHLNIFVNRQNILMKQHANLNYRISSDAKVSNVLEKLEEVLILYQKQSVQLLAKTRFSIFFSQKLFFKVRKGTPISFANKLGVFLKKSVVFDMLNILNIIYYSNLNFFYFEFRDKIK